MIAPRLVVAIGNASRGDDALGPTLAAALQAAGAFERGDAELLEVHQLQVEDSLALLQRRAVLFIDACREPVPGGAALERLAPAYGPTVFTHALAPAQLLAEAQRVWGVELPPSWLLAVQGHDFTLGAPLSAAASVHAERAFALAQAWLGEPVEPGTSGTATPCLHGLADS